MFITVPLQLKLQYNLQSSCQETISVASNLSRKNNNKKSIIEGVEKLKKKKILWSYSGGPEVKHDDVHVVLVITQKP